MAVTLRRISYNLSPEATKSIRKWRDRNRELCDQIQTLNKKLRQAPASTEANNAFAGRFWPLANELGRNTYSIARNMIEHVVGQDFQATCWAARSDTLPAEIIGGRWMFCGHEYSSRASQPPIVRKHGMEPIEHDPITGQLPAEIGEDTQDVCMINMPGPDYYKNPVFRQGLWNCAFLALKPERLLVSSQAIQEMTPEQEGEKLIQWCQQRFRAVTATGVKGIDLMGCYTLRASNDDSAKIDYPRLIFYLVGLYKKNSTLSLSPLASP
jgi:hypothetical protein